MFSTENSHSNQNLEMFFSTTRSLRKA